MATLFGDLVIVIPGILGSRLVRREGSKEVTVWDFSVRSLPRLLREIVTDGLVLEGNDSAPQDDVRAADLFRNQWIPGFFGVDDYQDLVESLRAAVSDQRQLLTFPYDWRASNRFAAERLEVTALSALKQWKEASGNQDAKLWFVCHSMGGLVARYFCEALGGAKYTRGIVTIGTPHRGSVKALGALVNGMNLGPLCLTKMVRSLPSVYELLPLFPSVRTEVMGSALSMHRVAEFFCLDSVTGQDTAVAGLTQSSAAAKLAPLGGIDRTMLKRALEFHAGIRLPAEARAREGGPSPYRQEVFFNRRQLTPLSARFAGHGLDILNSYPYENQGVIHERVDRGDGTVPSFSAVPIEWSDTSAAIALAEKHAAMQSAIAVRDSIFNWLRPLDVRTMKGSALDDRSAVELNVPVAISRRNELPIQVASLKSMNLTIKLESVESGFTTTQPLMSPGDDIYATVFFKNLSAGVKRVTAVPADRRAPSVSDYVFVSDF